MKPDSPLVTKFLLANAWGKGEYPKKLIVVHSAETPEGVKWAEALMGPNWFQRETTPASCHYFVDEDSIVQGVPELGWAYHCGRPGSKHSVGVEQAGYSRFNRAEWTTPSMNKQRWLLAKLIVDISIRRNISLSKATDNTIREGVQGRGKGGWCYHHDITRVVGGTTHYDPGNNYPTDLLEADIRRVVSKPPPSTAKDDDMVRLIRLTGDPAVWCVDLGQKTKWLVPGLEMLGFLQALGVQTVIEPQGKHILDGFRDVTNAKNFPDEVFTRGEFSGNYIQDVLTAILSELRTNERPS